jgi:antitoxin (DNA-binding transcriptional repressor) of toxin-antitoxin stability system
MTATLEQTQSELPRLIRLAQRGEEVLITSEGTPVAKLTGLPLPRAATDRRSWLARLARLRAATTTGKTGPTTEQILEEDRGD